ncbi:GNAT family N-acetyltransferase [Clostridium sp. MD294]|uniref:GNAT family N-acetyltransferase n=1 Tax=Clostridium sp. MD294 TaxID=97138 RepID=UPI0002CB9439|nr:GNAT family N-acetyltransferase [Clostridium sp. MD294]NDO45920.1 GNAT family N-acetyltransferase [Clostridium sp. MD294]USF30421.1 Peptidyl-lysine N-acetyltransferase YiaC [Clostridium sp. MD294]
MLIKKEFVYEHLEELAKIWLETNIQAHHFIVEQYWQSNIELVKKALPDAMIFCQGEKDIKGFLGVSDGFIHGLFVKKEFQRMGIGKALIEEAKQYFDTLSLCVYTKNSNAVAFYQNMGFEIQKQSVQKETGEQEYSMIYRKK